MPIAESLLPEFDHEFATARKLLERVPEAEFGWKPHAKSMSLGQLATHVANLAFWGTMTLSRDFYDLAANDDPESRLPPASSRDQLLKDLDDKVKTARGVLAQTTDAQMLAPWSLKHGDHVIFTVPRVAAMRTFVMNHMIHHRGQLSVYLRLKDVPLPSIYGPTADEQ
jgi:uncharacterized damage-inducible protein DinB